MITHDSDPACQLIEVGDLRPDSPHEAVRRHRPALEAMVEWVRTFLGQPHERLGRSGVVCPFVGPSLTEGLFWMTVYPGPDRLETRDEFLAKHRRWFPGLEPQRGERAAYKVIVVLFPDLPAEEAPGVIEEMYRLTKPAFNAEKLASAACYPTSSKPGLRRPDFRPFSSPVPFLAFRNMVMCDIHALRDRAEFLVYLAEFRHELPPRYQPLLRELAERFDVPWAALGFPALGGGHAV
jgi:hypothetical protein